MKKKLVKVSLLLSVVALASACSAQTIVSKPSFLSYKNSVQFEEFNDKFKELSELCPITNLSPDVEDKSFSLATSTQKHIEESVKRVGDVKEMVFSHITSYNTIAVYGAYDAEQTLFEYNGEQFISSNQQYYNKEKVTGNIETKLSKFVLEKEIRMDADPAILIANKDKKLVSETPYSGDDFVTLSKTIAYYSLFVDSRFPTESRWSAVDDSLKGYYTFYVDNNTLTVVYDQSEGVKHYDDAEDRIIDKQSINRYRVMQFYFSETEIRYTDYLKYNYKIETYSYLDDSIITDTRTASEVKATKSIIKLDDSVNVEKPATALYRKGNETLENLYFVSLD